MYGDKTRAGVSIFDVRAYFRDIGRNHFGRVSAHITLPVRDVPGVAVDVTVRFMGGVGALGGSTYERGVSGGFPCSQSRTLAGLLLRLALELDQKLTEERDTAKRTRQGRLPL
jgi:hypothetical protein